MNTNKIVITVGGVIAFTIFLCLDMQQYLTLAALKGNRQNLEDYYAAHKLTITGVICSATDTVQQNLHQEVLAIVTPA